MGREKVATRNAIKKEAMYERIGGICYWGRHYIYKDYKESCIFDKNIEEKIRTNIEEATRFAPYMGIYRGIGM